MTKCENCCHLWVAIIQSTSWKEKRSYDHFLHVFYLSCKTYSSNISVLKNFIKLYNFLKHALNEIHLVWRMVSYIVQLLFVLHSLSWLCQPLLWCLILYINFVFSLKNKYSKIISNNVYSSYWWHLWVCICCLKLGQHRWVVRNLV